MYCIIQNKGLNLDVQIQCNMDRKFSFFNIALTGYIPVKGFQVALFLCRFRNLWGF